MRNGKKTVLKRGMGANEREKERQTEKGGRENRGRDKSKLKYKFYKSTKRFEYSFKISR